MFQAYRCLYHFHTFISHLRNEAIDIDSFLTFCLLRHGINGDVGPSTSNAGAEITPDT